MKTEEIVRLLIDERDRLNRAIELLQGPVRRRGRPPKALAGGGGAVPSPLRKKRGGMSAAAKKAASARMKAYWAKRKKAKE